ncbi:MAG: hypothetical protein Q8O10_11055 [candidate division Zixibacteria bacterium]|nr:hypothetical protein [candidate division Zixibacteria bacterium]
MSNEKLKELLVDSGKIYEDILTDVLKPFVGLEKTGDIIFHSSYKDAPPDIKIFVYLLGRKAALHLGLLPETENEATKPKFIQERTGMPMGTVNPALVRLHKNRLLQKDDKSRYFVPNHAIRTIADLIKDWLKKGGN